MLLLKIIILATSLNWPMPVKDKGVLAFPQVPQNAIEDAIFDRFHNLEEDPLYCLPLLWEEKQASLHAQLPCLTLYDLVHHQVHSRDFRWVNRGNKIGVEINQDYYDALVKEKEMLSKDTKWLLNLGQALKLEVKILLMEDIFSRGDNFVEITTIPPRLYLATKLSAPTDQRVILTYSFPKKIDFKSAPPFDPKIISLIKNTLAANPYVDFVYIDEQKTGVKAAIRIAQTNEDPEKDEEDGVRTGYTYINVIAEDPVAIFLFPNDPDQVIHTFLHEIMHALGLPHHWDSWPIVDEAGKLTHPDNLPKDVAHYREYNHTTYAQTLPDSCNEAYLDIRCIRNQSIRTISGAILSVLYQLKDLYPNGVTFKFVPTEGESFYTLENIKQPDGSSLATYRGRVAGITLSNPGIDFTDLDFRDVPAFSYPPGGYHVKWGPDSYLKGVTVYLGPDANITFNSYMPEKLDQDKNLSIDLYTKIRRVYLSSHDDWVMIPPIHPNIEIYPGAGNDYIHIHSRNHTIIIGQSEGVDTIRAEDNGHMMLDYDQDELGYYWKDKKYCLLTFENGETHGICLEDYDMQSSKLLIRDEMGQTINLKDKKFLPLPKGHL